MLDARGLFPIHIAASKSAASSKRGGRRVKSRVMAAFYAQLADLLHSGVPLLRSLEHPRTAIVAAGAVRGAPRGPHRGRRRHQPGRRHRPAPQRLQRIGRQHGPRRSGRRLPRRRAQAHRRLHRAPGRPQVQGRRRHGLPVFLAVVGFVVLNVLVMFFVPRFEPIFKRLEEKGELPLLTQGDRRAQPPDVELGLGNHPRGRRFPSGSTGAGRATRRGVWWWTAGGCASRRMGKIYLSLALSRFTRILGDPAP